MNEYLDAEKSFADAYLSSFKKIHSEGIIKMKKMNKRLLTVGLSLAMAFSTASVALAAPKTPLHTINGGGTIFYPEYGNISESYGMNIRQLSTENVDGNATGSMQFSWHYPSGGEQSRAQKQYLMKADITYVNFNADGDEAWVGGTITKSNVDKLTFAVDPEDPNIPPIIADEDGNSIIEPVVGTTFHIRLKDGEATDTTDVDRLGMLFYCPTMPLHVSEEYSTLVKDWATGVYANETLYPLTNGNITIK